jgi:hypothetical protein
MALPNGAGGYQLGDGNLNEVVLGYQAAPQSVTGTATLTAAQLASGVLLVGSGATTAQTYTLPTGASLDALVTSAKINSTFELTLVNLGTSSGTAALAASTGITDGGNGLVAVAVTSSGRFLFRRTGDSTWVVYRV